jgi:hypothetical protein
MPSNPTLQSLQKPNTRVNESQTIGEDDLPLMRVCPPHRTSRPLSLGYVLRPRRTWLRHSPAAAGVVGNSPLPGEQLNQEVAQDQLGLQLSCHQADIRGEAIS